MTEITLRLDPVRRRALTDLADAQGRLPEELVGEAVDAYPRAEGVLVRAHAERIAKEYAELLRAGTSARRGLPPPRFSLSTGWISRVWTRIGCMTWSSTSPPVAKVTSQW